MAQGWDCSNCQDSRLIKILFQVLPRILYNDLPPVLSFFLSFSIYISTLALYFFYQLLKIYSGIPISCEVLFSYKIRLSLMLPDYYSHFIRRKFSNILLLQLLTTIRNDKIKILEIIMVIGILHFVQELFLLEIIIVYFNYSWLEY